ncbi:helix-turn-helix domain-containing protein [Micromonospora sp. MW-13]|uniref:helix-turn-helix domain-containing protein n=1 Tax=Micromonospora sp. MW-13 TaxID=2094022 RepID=UPI00210F6523|nr:helix-turn-helix domain-containing protein [Micromonospora sp. MW-13]
MICDSGRSRHSGPDVSAGRRDSGRLGWALVVLSVVEQRLDAVRAVLAGSVVTEVAANCGVHRSTVHRWVGRYLTEQLAGLADRSHRPHSSPGRVVEAVEVAVAEMRREHPRWGSRRIRLEMLRRPGPSVAQTLVVPSERHPALDVGQLIVAADSTAGGRHRGSSAVELGSRQQHRVCGFRQQSRSCQGPSMSVAILRV